MSKPSHSLAQLLAALAECVNLLPLFGVWCGTPLALFGVKMNWLGMLDSFAVMLCVSCPFLVKFQAD